MHNVIYVKSMFKEIGILLFWVEGIHQLKTVKERYSVLVKIYFLKVWSIWQYTSVHICKIVHVRFLYFTSCKIYLDLKKNNFFKKAHPMLLQLGTGNQVLGDHGQRIKPNTQSLQQKEREQVY